MCAHRKKTPTVDRRARVFSHKHRPIATSAKRVLCIAPATVPSRLEVVIAGITAPSLTSSACRVLLCCVYISTRHAFPTTHRTQTNRLRTHAGTSIQLRPLTASAGLAWSRRGYFRSSPVEGRKISPGTNATTLARKWQPHRIPRHSSRLCGYNHRILPLLLLTTTAAARTSASSLHDHACGLALSPQRVAGVVSPHVARLINNTRALSLTHAGLH